MGSIFVADRASTVDRLVLFLAGAFDPRLNNSFATISLEQLGTGERRRPGCLSDRLVDGLTGTDSHPAKEVEDALLTILSKLKSILLKLCGHNPWKEKYATDEYSKAIKEEPFEDSERNRKQRNA